MTMDEDENLTEKPYVRVIADDEIRAMLRHAGEMHMMDTGGHPGPKRASRRRAMDVIGQDEYRLVQCFRPDLFKEYADELNVRAAKRAYEEEPEEA